MTLTPLADLTGPAGPNAWAFVPEDYGLLAGSVNNLTALQATLDAAEDAGGGIVQLPKDRLIGWNGVLTIPPNVTLQGTGRSALGLIALGATSKIQCGVWAGDASRAGGIRDLHIDGDGTGDPEGLVQFQSVLAQMWNCTVTGGAGHNILLDAAQNATILGVYSTDAGDAALCLKNGAGGYNFMGSHFTNSPRCLAIEDGDASANNAYPYGSAHLNFWGGIFESSTNGVAPADLQCGGAIVFWGTGFSVNSTTTMSEACCVKINNDAFPSVSTYISFNSCTYNGGDNEYPAVIIEGNQVVSFDGIIYAQKHDPAFCVVASGTPRIRPDAEFDFIDVTASFAVTGGGSLVSLYSSQAATKDVKLPTARKTVESSSLDTDAGHKYWRDANGSQYYNDGTDFTEDLRTERRASGAFGVRVSTQQVLCTGVGTVAQRPAAAAALAGAFYINTDYKSIDWCDGTSWFSRSDEKPFNSQTGTSYTLAAADRYKTVTLFNASAIVLTVPTQASVPVPDNADFEFYAAGAGQITITPAGGVTVNNRGGRTKSNGQYAVFGLKHITSNTWVSYGDLST